MQTQKKNLRAKHFFYKSPVPRKTKIKVSPFFEGFLQWKSQSAIFGGSDLEIKPLEYINPEVIEISIHNPEQN
jgi:hypothetical protein